MRSKSGLSETFDNETPIELLLVDDNTEFVQTLSERLRLREMNAATANSGEDALHRLESQKPDVMITDLKMPGIDGIELLRRVKKKHPDIAVIILTGHGAKRDAALARWLGAFAYLEKPVNIDKLVATIYKAYKALRKKTD